jgi:ATP-dependent DNA helicase DinG
MFARDVLGEHGLLVQVASRYEHRPSQIRMAEIIERALEHDGTALIEAGTGTGKTLAYLVPAALSERRIVISTGTRALQDQLMHKDVPLLERALGRTVPITTLKGLSNYLCLRRLNELSRSAAADARPEFSRWLPVIQDWKARTETGDREELKELSEDAPIWAAIQSGSDTRIGPRCTFYEDCFVTKARRRAEEARIVVVNHHLFFADLALRTHGAGVIPNYDAVIFDEAHRIEDVATAFFGVQISAARIDSLLRDAERAFESARDLEIPRLLSSIAIRASDLWDALPRISNAESGRMTIPDSLLDKKIRDALFALDVALEALAEHARLSVTVSPSIPQIVRRAEQVRASIGKIAEPGPAHVAWIEQRGSRASIGASPVDVSSLFRDEVLHRVRSLIFTSATLATSRASEQSSSSPFAFTKKRLGIDFEVDEEVLPSPFDYSRQAALYVPSLPAPRDPHYLTLAAAEIGALISLTGGGAFVLCTSFRAMHELSRRLRPSLLDCDMLVMVQGEQPKHTQIERFRHAGNAVLFATSSFWEGIDVPGRALRLVVLDKLPFDVPSDPLVQARCTRIEENEGNAFMEYLVPSALLMLKQGFGRLIRTREDRGIVALLDSRIHTKGYGKVLLRNLPDAKRCTSMREVEDFWKDHHGILSL